MTEKRFVINNDMTFDDKIETFELSCLVDTENKTFYFLVDSIANVKSFVERLNALADENEQLKKEIGNLEHTRDFCADVCADCERLEKENKQLKQRIKELEIENEAQSDTIDGLQGFITHFDLEEIVK